MAEVVAHAAELEAQYREPMAPEDPPAVWKPVLAAVIVAVAVFVALRPPTGLAPATPPTLSPAELELGARAALYLQARQVEAFRARHGRLPGSLDELETRAPDVTFIRSNNRVYQLVTSSPDGSNLVYDSARPWEGFRTVASGWPGWNTQGTGP